VQVALGLHGRLEELLADVSESAPEKISQAFWHACAGGQPRAADLLLDRGADRHWVADYASGTALEAAMGFGTRQENVITWLKSRGAHSAKSEAGGEQAS